jgi:hypothetical protein
MRSFLRRLCRLIFALRRFLSEPIALRICILAPGRNLKFYIKVIWLKDKHARHEAVCNGVLLPINALPAMNKKHLDFIQMPKDVQVARLAWLAFFNQASVSLFLERALLLEFQV